jgi:phosphatidylethanolamine/phosphatidyl-N-methylethanolamine N-methyltransferase
MKNMNPTAKRYNRLSYIYDYLEGPIEYFRFASWRKRKKEKVTGNHLLEVGVGTGKNFPYYPEDIKITAIDFSPSMLKRAHKKADKEKIGVELIEMDVQQLSFPDNYFDTVFATFVFCSVPDPILGLRELKRVCKPNGKLLLLEHMRPGNFCSGVGPN